jgi:phosphoenolpyruvate carboxykinase (ATP)
VIRLESRRSVEDQARPDRRRDLSSSDLLRVAVERGEGILSSSGALVVSTGTFTGRSPDDKFIVDEADSRDAIWWGTVNRPMSGTHFDSLASDVQRHLDAISTFEQHLRVGDDPRYSYPVQLVTEQAWVALFARHLFLEPDDNGHGATQSPPIPIGTARIPRP